MNKPIANLQHPKMLLDPYAAWAAQEGVPITEDFGVDLIAVPTAHWARFGIEGGIVHLKGRGDFVSIFVLDLAPGANTSPQKHMFEEVVYVLSGHGSTTIETSDGRKHSFEWGPKSLFALPLNARYQHFNSSGRERARIASTNNLALMLNLFHNESFVFDNGYQFPERQGAAKWPKTGTAELVERPSTALAYSGQRWPRLAQKRGRSLQVGHLERFNPAVTALERALTVPLFFEVHRLSTFTPRSLDIDVVLDLMIHDLDIILDLVGEIPCEVRAAGLKILSDKVDIANVRLAFPGGCIANLTASRVSTERVRKLRLFQPHQYISLDYQKQEAVAFTVGGNQQIGFQPLAVIKEEPMIDYRGPAL